MFRALLHPARLLPSLSSPLLYLLEFHSLISVRLVARREVFFHEEGIGVGHRAFGSSLSGRWPRAEDAAIAATGSACSCACSGRECASKAFAGRSNSACVAT